MKFTEVKGSKMLDVQYFVIHRIQDEVGGTSTPFEESNEIAGPTMPVCAGP